MDNKLFYKLVKDAAAQPDKEMFVAEYGYPDWFDEISEDITDVVSCLESIHDAVWMPFKEVVKRSGLSQIKFAEKYCIPISTIENWCREASRCAVYDRIMIFRLEGWLK